MFTVIIKRSRLSSDVACFNDDHRLEIDSKKFVTDLRTSKRCLAYLTCLKETLVVARRAKICVVTFSTDVAHAAHGSSVDVKSCGAFLVGDCLSVVDSFIGSYR